MHWTRLTFLSLEWLWVLSGSACLAGAGLLALRRGFLGEIEAFLERVDRDPVGKRLPLILWGATIALSCVDYLALFRSFRMVGDSATIANIAWDAAHGYGPISSIFGGRNYLAMHFALTYSILSPLLYLWDSAGALALAQGAAVGSMILAVYLLTRLRGNPPLPAHLMAVLALSHPFFHYQLVHEIEDSLYTAPFFLWSAYCWESGKKIPAAILMALAMTTREQCPFLLVGVGLWLLWTATDRRGRAAGAGVSAGAVLLWFFELAVQNRMRSAWGYHEHHWKIFLELGGTPEAVRSLVLRRPWRVAAALAYPPAKLWVPIRTMLSFALLPLFAGAQLLPALTVWLPQQLADVANPYHQLIGHYSSYVLGPLLWAASHGLRAVFRRARGARKRYLVAWVLGVSGACFLASSWFMLPDGLIPRRWFVSVPHAVGEISPRAKVWSDENLSSQLAMRRYIKSVGTCNDAFEEGLFVPDRVLLSRYWFRLADPRCAARVMRFLTDRKFVRIFEEGDLVVLANPATSGDGSEPVQWARLPPE